MKGTIYANPTFIRKNMKSPTVISVNPLVVYDENRLYFNDHSFKWEFKDIVNCTFSPTYKVLLVLTDDYKIYVFTEQLQQITILHNWQPKYIVGFKLLEAHGVLLLIGTEEIQLMKINILTNIKRTKFLSSMKFHIKKQQHISVLPEDALKWNKGYGFNIEEDLLYVWSMLDIHFYSLMKLTLRSKILNLTKKENSISAALFSKHYKYTITGLLSGQVKVWRLPISSLYHHKEILIHSFSCHSREVEHIIPGNDSKTIISGALDLNICIMSIQTFQILRSFNFSGEYTKIFLFNHEMAYAIKDSYLGVLNFGNNMQFIADLNGVPICCDRSPHTKNLQRRQYQDIQITLNSNIGFQFNLNQLTNAPELNKINMKQLYPPLKSKSITQILSCPFFPNRYYLAVEDGDIFSCQMAGNIGKIDRHYIISKSNDSEKHPLNQTSTYIAFFHIVPPEVDTEMMEKTIDKKFVNTFENKLELYDRLKLLTIGCNRGSIVFVSIEDMSSIYCRVSYHRQRIIKIQEVFNETNKIDWLISICEQKFLKIMNFAGNRANCMYTIFCGEVYLDMISFDSNLAIILPKGLFQICRFQSYQQQPMMITNRQCINHEDDILSFDYRKDLSLILTSGKDHKIKIWTACKILIYQIVMDQSLQYCLWGSALNILVFQGNKLYCMRHLSLSLSKRDLTKIDKQFRQNFDIDFQITLTTFLQNHLIKGKQKNFRIKQSKRVMSLPQSPTQRNKSFSHKYQSNQDHIKTQVNQQVSNNAVLSTKTPLKKKKVALVKTQQSEEEKSRLQTDLTALRKHIQQLSNIKKAANQSMLPKIKAKNEDIFVEFMREKLLNKKLLTRRDITLNRIIMKNLIKDHIGGENEMVSSFKLE